MAEAASAGINALLVLSRSPQETRRLGQLLGQLLVAGTTVALAGDLGSGKTVFVQGLAQGLEVPPAYYITSPTYAIIHDYPGRLPLFHVDLYRLTSPEEMEDIGLCELFSERAVVALEWAERLPRRYFHEHLLVVLKILTEDVREITLIPYGQAAADLIGEIKKRM